MYEWVKKEKYHQPSKVNYFGVLQPLLLHSKCGIAAPVLNGWFDFLQFHNLLKKTTYLTCNLYRKITENYIKLRAM